ncbi:MAG: TrkH family potassium uptake protein [Nitrospirales bacterium]|nr:TrkH family potassium uptake protein [Nitrospirales bacterium]
MEHTIIQQGMAARVLDWARGGQYTAKQIVPMAFLGMILIGALLLMLPFATEGPGIRFIDALFTMTSAVCVTGLIVLDTPREFTLFGELVILLGMQLGGLGYSATATLLLLALGRRIGLRERMMMMEVLNTLSMEGLVRFVKVIVAITFIAESVGALILAARFSFDMDPARALYFGIFHAVSAFNNAGFSLFADNLIGYRTDLTVNLTISTLIMLGGIGFLVYRDVLDNIHGHRFRLSTHTKLALLVSVLLILGGTLGIWVFEVQNEKTLAAMPVGDQVLAAYFHSVSARTAGFNTIDLGLVATPTLYLIILLMIVGASPGSTGGGIKTTTFGIICASIWGTLKGRADVMMFHRRIPQELVIKSYVLALLALGLVTGFTMLLSYSENQPFLRIMFEVASAAGTVGLSTGNGGVLSLSALFSDFGKCVIIATMFLGRLGPLAIGLFAVKTHEDLRYRYAQARVVLG